MANFSDNIDKKNHFYGIPAWKKVKFEREILKYFVGEGSGEISGLEESFSNSFSLANLCDSVCIRFKLRKAISPHNSIFKNFEYISEVIRNCEWYEFLEFIEILGDVILEADFKAQEEIEYGSGEWNHELNWKIYTFGYNSYFSLVNNFLKNELPEYLLAIDGRIYSRKNEDPLLASSDILNLENQKKSDKNLLLKKSKIEDLLQALDYSGLEQDDRISMDRAFDLMINENYKQALLLFFPTLESVVNKKIKPLNHENQKFSGLYNKLQFLEKHKLITKNFTKLIPLNETRNVAAHGEYEEVGNFALLDCLRVIEAFRLLLSVE